MAPWPGRTNSHRSIDSSTNNGQTSSPRPHAGSPSARFTSGSRMTDFEVLDNSQIQGDSSSSDEGLHPSRPQRPARHTRSVSHPFPSLFSSKKKKPEPPTTKDSDSEPTDDAAPMSKPSRPQIRGHRNGSSTGSKDYNTGNCITCGSLVRWPRELHVFKCTICLTINDILPHDMTSRREGTQKSTAELEERPWSNEKPLSVEHTKLLTIQCLSSFLLSVLQDRSKIMRLGYQGTRPQRYSVSPDDSRNSLSLPAGTRASRPNASEVSESGSLLDEMAELSIRGQQQRTNGMLRSYSTSYPQGRPTLRDMTPPDDRSYHNQQPPSLEPERKHVFKELEDYIISCFASFHCLNNSFRTPRSGHHTRNGGGSMRRRNPEPRRESQNTDCPIIDLDAKLLLLGDFAENGAWWTGGQGNQPPGRTTSTRSENGQSPVSTRSPYIDWSQVEEWYTAVIEAARSWRSVYDEIIDDDPTLAVPSAILQDIETLILMGQDHAQRTLLKASEIILKRPGRILTEPHQLRFLLIVSANPLLHASHKPYVGEFTHTENSNLGHGSPSSQGSGPASGRHSGIIKRIVGLMSHATNDCHNHLVAWFARYPEPSFVRVKDMVAGFLAYRLNRQNEKKRDIKIDLTGGLIPSMGAGQSPASLHAALGERSGSVRKQKETPPRIIYQDDWQIRAAAQVLGFLFAANNMGHVRRHSASHLDNLAGSTRDRVQARGQVLATSDFYTTLLDDSNLLADFEAWESKRGKFSFCQYPFLLSIWAKIQILEYDARRQMQNKARDAFFDSIMTRRTIEQFLVLHIRRDCLVEDSLKAVGEVIGGGGEEIKKGLRIIFKGEEGVDAGGLRKEWFLLLVREVFNPDHGMFIYDEDSQYCYFNPSSLEPSEQFFLVGVVFGLAIYNSTILDVALPPFAFRKLLMAAPPPAAASTSQPRQSMTYSLDDLAEYRPRLASGLRQLLDYEGDVESTFYLDFVVDVDKYGLTERVPLCPGGERRAVTNSNRREYVDLYVRYLLDTAVTRQFEPFKRGFYTVCGGNALSLFRPEEIELLVRGSDEALDIRSLRGAAAYDNWGVPNPADREPTIQWFWEAFENASPKGQRKLLLFITGSDRIPATGAASLTIRITCLGDDCERYPTARTCFNVLTLYRYPTREKLETMLWRAVYESEGFGLK
ncbi:putative E3 ubiquitin-protein ligase [Diplogelasinospora grovesii]|uniref:HECT-type E3 ubiquitin transferase n=1 Tax=Diplogelasinospora grovesii TaxID=303347 RepID=A0AAN6NG40_9PEZI|nr:putative E3 ubiquitin-protein ligase [Diplogelasinospora grovesii]